jgi:hypothetical protein
MAVTQKGVPMQRQGDQVIGFLNSTQVKSIQGYQDMASLNSWYHQDPLNNHLGLMQFWGNQDRTTVPIYGELMKNKSIIEVDGFEGSFSYDIPIEEAKGCITEVDLSAQQFPGVDGSPFEIGLDREYTKGDILTYDPEFGEQVIVTDDANVRMEGTAFIHTVALITNDKLRYFPSHQLAKGISYYKLSHAGGEYTTEFSHVEFPDTVGHMTCEFKLGGIRGAQAYVTGFADKKTKNFSGAAASSQQFLDKISQEADAKGEFVFVTNIDKSTGKPNMKNASIGTTMEYLVMKELEKMTAQSLLFQKAGTVNDGNGSFRINEGLWHQLRRGKRILYGRPGGITRSKIKEAAEYVFRSNPTLDYRERRIKFKCGTRAYDNVLEIFSEEVNAQLDRLSAFLGTDRQLPKSPISGTSLTELKLEEVRFTEVFLPGIGTVELEKDESLDYSVMSDRFSTGSHGDGMAHTTYSMVIWDASNQGYSNNKNLPKGTKLVEGGNSNSNIFIVKPKGEMTYWGRENGRYDIDKAGGIVSSSKYIGTEFWAFNSSSIWVKDLTKFVMIELNPAARLGFN